MIHHLGDLSFVRGAGKGWLVFEAVTGASNSSIPKGPSGEQTPYSVETESNYVVE